LGGELGVGGFVGGGSGELDVGDEAGDGAGGFGIGREMGAADEVEVYDVAAQDGVVAVAESGEEVGVGHKRQGNRD